MNRAGTEYRAMRTVIIAERSTIGFSISPGSNPSTGSGARFSRSVAKSSPTVRIRDEIRRRSSDDDD